ncbi:MAG: DUF4007 family protein [Acutalibacteraceae bacterium]|nr:DUF4007 family protein [Acutalibacteraceae bacterium]
MIKSSTLEFHETFQPEMPYIAKILRLASENYSGTKFEISDCTGIPTGKQKGKVEPHIRYAKCMGLVDYSIDNGVYSLQLTPLGEEVFVQDSYLHEDLTCWLCHYGMTKKGSFAPQWEYITHSAHPGFGEKISQERLFSLSSTWCDVSQENLLKKVFSVVKNSYTEGCFQRLNFLSWDGIIEFREHPEKFDLVFVYAYALLDSWERIYPDKQEITDLELKNEIGFNRIFGLNEDECNYVIDSLAYEGFITVNRQLYPATVIRLSNSTNVISQMYSRLL